VQLVEEDREHFKQEIKQLNGFYVHSSYLINLASLGTFGKRLLLAELQLANTLGATGIVFHLGSAKGKESRFDGFKALIKTLKCIIDVFPGQILLENTAHKNLVLGSDIMDISEIMEKLSHHERVFFCLDTAHAYSFGYDIKTAQSRQLFLEFLSHRIGFEKLALIHLNDTKTVCGSYTDVHACFTTGIIGEDALKTLVYSPSLHHIPLILEINNSEYAHLQHIRKTLSQ
jgi:deoxyribonuclease-4